MENLEIKNTVESKNQVSKYVFLEGAKSGIPKIMFVGNSITKHGPAPHIGWYGNWGMAASSQDKDYVHLVIKHIKEKYHDAYFCIVQAAEWERNYKNCDLCGIFQRAADFAPDIIITRLSENVPVEELDATLFVEKMYGFHSFLSQNSEKVKHIVTSNVFNNKAKDAALKEYAERFGAEYVYLDDYCENEENKALEYANEGVRLHPGDKGMRFIADRIIKVLDKMI